MDEAPARRAKVERLRSETLLRGPVFDVRRDAVRLPSGLEQDVFVVEHGGAVGIAPLLPDGRLLLVRQYRHAVSETLLEIPAGRLEPDEAPLGAARRELEEETGHAAGAWRELGAIYPAPGFCSERITLFEARDLRALPGGGAPPDDDEEIETLALPLDEVLRRTRDAKTWIAASLLLRERGSSGA